MFISLGMSSPAHCRRFHTFLLANLTVLLPAAEGELGVRDPQTALVLPLVLLLFGSGCLKGAEEEDEEEGCSHLSHHKSLTMLDSGKRGLRKCL